MAHAQKPDFVFRAKRTSPFKSAGASVQSSTGSRGVCISCSNAGYTMFRGSVKGTGYPLHSPVSPSLPLPCVTVCHHISTGLYSQLQRRRVLADSADYLYWHSGDVCHHISTGLYCPLIFIFVLLRCRSQWPRGLRRRSTAARLLRLWVRIPPGAWMFGLLWVLCVVR